jgi:hypothetical protein
VQRGEELVALVFRHRELGHLPIFSVRQSGGK